VFFANLVLGRGLGSITAIRFALERRRELAFLALGLVWKISNGLLGGAGTVSTKGLRSVRSSLSAFVRVSRAIPALTVVGSSTVSSVGDIDAVTLLANNPPSPARQTAAIQTVLIINDPTLRAQSVGTPVFASAP
jgi:hypothetical protein